MHAFPCTHVFPCMAGTMQHWQSLLHCFVAALRSAGVILSVWNPDASWERDDMLRVVATMGVPTQVGVPHHFLFEGGSCDCCVEGADSIVESLTSPLIGSPLLLPTTRPPLSPTHVGSSHACPVVQPQTHITYHPLSITPHPFCTNLRLCRLVPLNPPTPSHAQTHIIYDHLDVILHPLAFHLTEGLAVAFWVRRLPAVAFSCFWVGGHCSMCSPWRALERR